MKYSLWSKCALICKNNFLMDSTRYETQTFIGPIKHHITLVKNMFLHINPDSSCDRQIIECNVLHCFNNCKCIECTNKQS